MSGGIGGVGVWNDRHGVPDGQYQNFVRVATAPNNTFTPRPLTAPSSKLPITWTDALVNGRTYQGDPWRVEGRVVLQSVSPSAALLAAAAAMAEAEDATEIATSDNGTAQGAICEYRIPAGSIAVVRVAQVRMGSNLGYQKVKIAVQIGGVQDVRQTGQTGEVMNFSQEIGVELDAEIPLALRVDGQNTGAIVRLIARNEDTEAPHYVEAMLRGSLFPYAMYEQPSLRV